MVHTSPMLVDDLDCDDGDREASTLADPRFSFRSLSLESAGYSDLEYHSDERPFAATPDRSARRRERQRESIEVLERAPSFQYDRRVDAGEFRIAILQPGSGASPVRIDLMRASLRAPPGDYTCLSYAWGSQARDATVLLNGHGLRVTMNLLHALQCLRRPKNPLWIWIDQICINQADRVEREQQVDNMKHIFNQARKVYVWLGEADAGSDLLFRYAKQIRQRHDSSSSPLNRIFERRDMRNAMQSLLHRAWFRRVWVIPEVALACNTKVICGGSTMTWALLTKLIRYIPQPAKPGFDKQISLLGNPRQRVAIITQMIASQNEGKDHTDITQLLVLAKSSQATHAHDMVYSFYGLTYLSLFPDYVSNAAKVFVDIIEYYVWNILESDAYSSCHELTEEQKTFQAMSILYSAGALHQEHDRHTLPSWVPDWTFPWDLSPVWCKTTANFVSSPKDQWSKGIRSEYRAGGDERGEFQVLKASSSMHRLRISALVFDIIATTSTLTPAPTPDSTMVLSTSPIHTSTMDDTPTLRYGRHFFTTEKSHSGLATPGIAVDDVIAVLIGGDVPVVLRPCPEYDGKQKAYKLLCECYVQAPQVMHGDMLRESWTFAEEIILL